MKKVKFEDIKTLEPSSFLIHEYISCQKDEAGWLNFFRNKKSISSNYYSVILKQPLKKKTSIVVKINDIQVNDPFLDIGIISE